MCGFRALFGWGVVCGGHPCGTNANSVSRKDDCCPRCVLSRRWRVSPSYDQGGEVMNLLAITTRDGLRVKNILVKESGPDSQRIHVRDENCRLLASYETKRTEHDPNADVKMLVTALAVILNHGLTLGQVRALQQVVPGLTLHQR